MPDDIYLKLENNIKRIIENFNMGEISNIQFVEDVVFEYQIAYKDASDTHKTELKNSFMRFIKTILHKIEKLGDENKNIDKSSNISIIFDSARILLKLLSEYNDETNSTHFDYTNETGGIMISVVNKIFSFSNINNLKDLIVELLDRANASGILTEDEINKFIMPILDRINEKYK